jgi:single-stranded DNA-binding protein
MIIGELEEPRTYQDRDGNTRVSLDVTARQIKFIGSRGDNAGGGSYSSPPAAVGAQNSGNDDFSSDEDIPF